jgi:hypothetical protein
MDANTSENPGTAAVASGLDMVRARAQKQKHVRLTRLDAPDAMNVRTCWHSIQSLKNKSAESEEPEAAEPSFLRRLWSDFQVAIGNR